MTQGGERERLDAALASAGETITLRRQTVAEEGVSNVDVDCRARIDTVAEADIVGTVSFQDMKVIMSPSQILSEDWPDGETAALPKVNDFVVIRGKQRQIKKVDAIIINDIWVRINLIVAG